MRLLDEFEHEDHISVLTTNPDGRFQTAISRPDFNSNQWIVVEEYNSESEAEVGHARWVSIMKENNGVDTVTKVLLGIWKSGQLERFLER